MSDTPRMDLVAGSEYELETARQIERELAAVTAERDALMQDCPERYNGDCIAEDNIVPCHIGHCFKLRSVNQQP